MRRLKSKVFKIPLIVDPNPEEKTAVSECQLTSIADSSRSTPTEEPPSLLACLEYELEDFNSCFVYLHGFPDQTCDHRESSKVYGTFCSRLPRKAADFLVRDKLAFLGFNFRGTPGSSTKFYDKTVSRELDDLILVLRYIRKEFQQIQNIHVIGLSTGAIIGALARRTITETLGNQENHLVRTITLIASCGAYGMLKPLTYDFTGEQLESFRTKGWCKKEFWLPVGHSSNPEAAEGPAKTRENGHQKAKYTIPLGRQYMDDFVKLSVAEAVREGVIPLLVIHGSADKNVPVKEGCQVFDIAAGPKEWLLIPKGNHLLTSAKHMKKVLLAIRKFTSKYNVGVD